MSWIISQVSLNLPLDFRWAWCREKNADPADVDL